MATVICHTDGCANAELPLSVSLTYEDEEGNTQSVDAVACGVCGQEITDVKEASTTT